MAHPPVVPPGITGISGPVTETHNGGVEDWAEAKPVKYYTNAFIVQDGKILLGYKKRGFGKDMYNGFGGKIEPHETSAQAAARELEEEAGITAPLVKCGVLYFTSESVDHDIHIDVYTAKEYTGTITEQVAQTDEMRPKWFATSASLEATDLSPMPYSQMWPDVVFWMPSFLAGKCFVGRTDFGKDEKRRKWWFAESHLI